MVTTDLELLRSIFKDVRQHIAVGVITQLGLSQSATTLRAQVKLLPEEREIVAQVGFSAVGASTGFIDFPEINDLVLVAFAHDPSVERPDHDDAYVIARFPSSEEPIPAFAQSGSSVVYSHPGKKMYVGSNTKVGIGRPNVEPAEPLVLGQTLVTGLTSLINSILNASQIGWHPLGPVFLDPGIRTALVNFKTTYLDTASTNILSQIGFTERGV